MSDVVLRVQDIAVHFKVHEGSLLQHKTHTIRAVNGVSFDLHAGETLGIVGESGCGKSTLARTILGLLRPNRGRVLWLGENLSELTDEELRKKRKELQIVFQDPLASLNPRMTVGDIIAEPLWTFYPKIANVQVEERVRGMMKMVGLLPNQINRYPHEFSGGQCQRIGIARALVLNPKLIIADEPVSALDVSIQAQIINLLKNLQKKLNLSLIFIAHDLSVVKHISDRVMVMYLGRSMEVSRRETLYRRPLHPYTSALVKAAPIPDPRRARAQLDSGLTGDMPSPFSPPPGCVFHTRCPWAMKRCRIDVPPLRRMENGDWVACHLAEELDLTIRDPEMAAG
jgi:oligopeptide transport system ATP-binding protein